MVSTRRAEHGFTLVELLIVISIIGILARFLFVNFAEVRERGRDARRKSDFAEIRKALRLYYNDYQKYPTDDSGSIVACGADGTSTCVWGEAMAIGTTSYIAKLPVDPQNTGSFVYSYQQTSGGEGFRLTTLLENGSDAQDSESQIRCGVLAEDVQNDVYMTCAE